MRTTRQRLMTARRDLDRAGQIGAPMMLLIIIGARVAELEVEYAEEQAEAAALRDVPFAQWGVRRTDA